MKTYDEVAEEWRGLFNKFPQSRLPKVDDEFYYFDELEADDACAFFEQELHHVEGPQAGQKL